MTTLHIMKTTLPQYQKCSQIYGEKLCYIYVLLKKILKIKLAFKINFVYYLLAALMFTLNPTVYKTKFFVFYKVEP